MPHLRSAWCTRGVPIAAFVVAALAARAAFGSPLDTTWVQRGFPIANTALLEMAPQVIADPAGGFVATWQTSSNGYPAGDSIWVQRFDRNAETLWPPLVFLGTSNEGGAVIEGDGRGGVFLLYSGFGLHVQHVRGDGRVAPGWEALGVELAEDPLPSRMARMCSDDSGGVIVCWLEPPSIYVQDGDLLVQRVDALGRLRWGEYGIPVPGVPSPRTRPAIVPDGIGGAILTWDEGCACGWIECNCEPRHIYAQRIASDGTVQWGGNGVLVCDPLPGARGDTHLVSDGTGGAIVAWVDNRNEAAGAGSDLYAQRLDHNGTRLWSSNGTAACSAQGLQFQLAMVADGASGALLAWIDWRHFSASPDPFEIFVQRLDARGDVWPGWPTNGARAGLTPAWKAPTLVADALGGAMVTWSDAYSSPLGFALGRQAFVQRLTPGGAIARGWSDTGISVSIDDSVKVDPSAVLLGDGDVVVTWRDSRHGQPFSDIYATRISAAGQFEPAVTVVSARASYTEATFEWRVRQGGGIAAHLERRVPGGPWTLLASLVSDSDGRFTFADRALSPDQRYEYRLGMFASAEESFYGQTSIHTPPAPPLGLAIASPQPSREGLSVAARLPVGALAQLEVFDLQGRRIWSREIGSMGPGDHRIDVAAPGVLPPGLYLLRVTQSDHTARARAVVIR